MNRSREAAVLLACVVSALFVLAVLALNAVRLWSAVGREVERAQVAYVQHMGRGEPVENNATLLGHCLREEMLKSARSGLLHPDAWAVTARIRALPFCTQILPAIPASTPPVITAPRVRAIVTSAPVAPPGTTSRRAAAIHAD